MKRLAVAVFGLMMASVAVGADWGPAIESVKGNKTYVDLSSVKTSNISGKNVAGSWTKTINKVAEPFNKKGKVAEYKAFSWCDCKEKTKSNNVSIVLYSSNQSIIESSNYMVDGFYPIVPDSIAENVFNITCGVAMWQEYATIPSDNSGKKNQYQLDSLARRYPYQADLLKGKEYEPQYISDEEAKKLFPDMYNK